MLYYWQINNNYEDDSIFLANTGTLDEAKVREAILDAHVSTVLYDNAMPIDTVLKLKKCVPEVNFKRSYDMRMYMRSLREDCYEIQNPVFALDGSVKEPFHLIKHHMTSDAKTAEPIAEETFGHPGRRVMWSCCHPTDVVVWLCSHMEFHKPITYLECCTQFAESFRHVCSHLPKGSRLYAVDFYQKVNGFPMTEEQKRDYDIRRIGFSGNLAYNETVEKLVADNPDLHIDISFYDANHKSRDDRALRALAKVSDVVIVHDADFEEVTSMCMDVFGDAPFEVHGTMTTKVQSRIYLLHQSDRWTFKK